MLAGEKSGLSPHACADGTLLDTNHFTKVLLVTSGCGGICTLHHDDPDLY